MKKNILLICTAFVLCSCGSKGELYPDLYQQQPYTEAETQPETTEPVTSAEPATVPVTESVTEAVTAAADPSQETTAVQTEPATADTSSTPTASSERMNKYPELYKAEAKRMFDEIYAANDGRANIEYTLRDLDVDGVPELILKHGTAEYDFITTVYTIDAGCNVKVIGDNLMGSHTAFGYDSNSGELVLKTGSMGTGSCTWIKYVPGSEGVSVDKVVEVSYLDYNDFERQMAEMSIVSLPFTDMFSFSTDRDPKTYIYEADGSYAEYDGCNYSAIN